MKGPSKKRFEEIFQTGRRVKGEFIRISALPGTGLVGIATSKKIGNRPKRNRVRRRISSALQHQLDAGTQSLDYVLIVSQQAQTAPYERIVDEVAMLIRQVVQKWAENSECS